MLFTGEGFRGDSRINRIHFYPSMTGQPRNMHENNTKHGTHRRESDDQEAKQNLLRSHGNQREEKIV